MSSAAADAARVRHVAGCFELRDRALIEVSGADRVRWADGMLSNDLKGLEPGAERSGCEALLLTPQGRIVSDLHVLVRDDALWLELPAEARDEALARLEKFIIADDVSLVDSSAAWRRFALEGPDSAAWLSRAASASFPAPAPDCGVEVELGGATVVAGAWGCSGEPAFQLIAPADGADAVFEALARAAGEGALVAGEPEVLEVLRIEAGRPRFGAELGPDVLPAEVGLVGRAVSVTKGCYTGQEVVARMASRDAAAHRLVGFRFEADGASPGDPVSVEGKTVGELTSACRSATAGEIGLGFVRRAHAEPGLAVRVGERPARVAALPFVAPRRA